MMWALTMLQDFESGQHWLNSCKCFPAGSRRALVAKVVEIESRYFRAGLRVRIPEDTILVRGVPDCCVLTLGTARVVYLDYANLFQVKLVRIHQMLHSRYLRVKTRGLEQRVSSCGRSSDRGVFLRSAMLKCRACAGEGVASSLESTDSYRGRSSTRRERTPRRWNKLDLATFGIHLLSLYTRYLLHDKWMFGIYISNSSPENPNQFGP